LDRRGTDSFLGQTRLPGAGDHFLKENSIALNLMGDWCGPRSDTERLKTGARKLDNQIQRVDRMGEEKETLLRGKVFAA